MSKFKLNVSSSTYKKQIFEGFSRLQQNDEFVNMTLAAEGHLVKVHQSIVALASPYLKDMLLSLPCQHPVIFLSGVSHEVLCFILEYIYSGEVEVPVEKMQSFMHSAQAMQIAGLRSIKPPMDDEMLIQEKKTKLCPPSQPQIHSKSEATAKIQNDMNFDVHFQESFFVQPAETKNQANGQLLLNIDISKLSSGRESQNLTNMNAIDTFTNIDLDGNKDNVMDSESHTNGQLSSNNISSSEGNNATQNLIDMDPCGTSVDITMDSSEDDAMESETHTNEHLPSSIDIPSSSEGNNESHNFRNINKCGKTFSITLDDTENNDNTSQKPVAKIEIIGQTIINPNLATMHDQGQLPQLYTVALANMKKQIGGNSSQTDHSFDKLLNVDAKSFVQQCNPSTEPANTSLSDTQFGSETEDTAKITDSLLYTASNRGALQLILNHFMYYCHYQRNEGRKRRWRCIDYRDAHCPVIVDTVGEQIVRRKHKHCHPNHDQKIRKKFAKKDTKFFPSLEMAQEIIVQGKGKTDTKCGTSNTKRQKRDDEDDKGTFVKCHCDDENN